MDLVRHPHVRSFKPRRRRLGAASQDALARLGDRYLLAETGPPLDWAEVFGRTAPVVVEIGFGGGEALVASAVADPARDHVGIEVHRPGVARVLRDAEEQGLEHVRVVDGDALEFLARVPAASVDEIRCFFPDPWPKARHRKRRLIRPDVVERFAAVLTPGGILHLATDWEDYAEQMVTVCRDAGWPALGAGERRGRPVTRFERRALAEGRLPVDLTFRRP